MSRYGIDYYGLSSYGPGSSVTYSATPFIARSSNYGEITLLWTDPVGDYSKIRLVRNRYGYPTNPYDGTMLIDAKNGFNTTFYVDTDVLQGSYYYYSIFVYEVETYTWVRSGDAIGLAVKNYKNGNRLYEYLPEIYKITSAYTATSANENTNLKNFLNLFGFQLDYAQTVIDLLIKRYSIEQANGVLIPLLLQQFGIRNEPEIGLQQSRILARDIIQVYKDKGSLEGLKEYIKAFANLAIPTAIAGTPNPAVNGIRISHNLMLDYNDSSFEEGVGHWVSSNNASLSQLGIKDITAVSLTSNVATLTVGTHGYRVGDKITIQGCPVPLFNSSTAKTLTAVTSTTISYSLTAADVSTRSVSAGIVTPVPAPWEEPTANSNFPNKAEGILSVKNTSATSGTVEFKCGDFTPIDMGIPVSADTQYTFSIYSTAGTTARSVTVKIDWYNRFGVYLSTSTGSAVSNNTTAFNTRHTVTGTAPTGAYYAVPVVSIASVAGSATSDTHYFDAAQFEASATATEFDEARNIHLTLRANRINELINPAFKAPYAPWSVDGATFSSREVTVEPGVDVFEVIQASLTSNVAKFTTGSTHHLEVGERVAVQGVGAPYDGAWTITARTTNTFDVSITNANIASASVNGTAYHAGQGFELVGTSTDVYVKSYTTDADYMPIYYPGTSYAFSIYGRTDVEPENIKLSVHWYDISKVLISSEQTDFIEVGPSITWTRASMLSTAPSNAAYAHVEIYWSVGTGNELMLDSAMFERASFILPYFDGDAESNTVQDADVFWEGGVANAGRSHFYKNRIAVFNRLKDTLPEFLNAGSTFVLYLAQPQT